jgi:hypothetical protein
MPFVKADLTDCDACNVSMLRRYRLCKCLPARAHAEATPEILQGNMLKVTYADNTVPCQGALDM